MIAAFSPSENNKLPLDVNAWKLNTDNTLEFVKLHLKKGESIEVHKNNVDVYFFVQSGKAEFIVDNNTIILEEGNLFFVEKGKDRGCRSLVDRELRLLVIKIL